MKSKKTAKKRKEVYMVVCIFYNPEADWPIVRSRTWGWFSEFKDAEEAVLNNYTDMYEIGYYNIAVIETAEEGLIPMSKEASWYQVEYEEVPVPAGYNPKVTKIDKPEKLKHYSHFWG